MSRHLTITIPHHRQLSFFAMPAISRRAFLALPALPALGQTGPALSKSDDDFLEDLSRRSFRFFWEESDENTGLVLDRVRAQGTSIGGRNLQAASTALTGFYLTALCIGSQRGWQDRNQIRQRVRRTLRHLASNQEHVRGWFYHFVNIKSGERVWNCELSTIDTAFLLAGVITAQQFFQGDSEVFRLAATIYNRIDFPWMVNPETGLIRMGWTPEKGFLRATWHNYRENAILHMLAIGSSTHPLPARCWYLFERDAIELAGYRYVGRGPIFTHQYSQAWLSLFGRRDGPPFQIDYFQNSVVATRALRAFCLNLRGIYPSFSPNCWGVTPSDSEIGYVGWGRPTSRGDMDGTVVPCAAGGSLMFAPDICLPALRYMYNQFAESIYGPFGFVDSFHPLTGWVDPDVVGIDVGITLLSAENLRTGSVWQWFNRSVDVQRAMGQVFSPAEA